MIGDINFKGYISIDGDNIGAKIEKLLIENKKNKLREFSGYIKYTINDISKFLENYNIELIFCAGDNLLGYGNIDCELIAKLTKKIKRYKINFSVGIGRTLCDVYLALKYSKAHGKHRITIVCNSKIIYSKKI